MDETRKNQLQEAGINVEDALGRFMGNGSLLEKFLIKFLDDQSYGQLKEAIAAGDRDTQLRAAHTLKGVCGNLSMVGLYELFTRQVELMRADRWEEAEAMMPEIARIYEHVTAVIRG